MVGLGTSGGKWWLEGGGQSGEGVGGGGQGGGGVSWG